VVSLAVPLGGAEQAAPGHYQPRWTRLAFAWPLGLEANVTATRSRTRAGAEQATHSIEAKYRLTLEPVDDDLRLRFSDLEMGSFGPNGPPPPSRPTELMAILANLVPD
jgi:hypothetical protein